MTLTTLGTDYFPKTSEGRFLCWLLAVYAFAVFGYITAMVASFLLHGKVRGPASAPPARDADLAALNQELAAIHSEISALRRGDPAPSRLPRS